MIHLWHGTEQRVGHLGDGQADFNLLGDVEDPSYLTSLTCSINGSWPEWSLQVGSRPDGYGDGRRLARTGHFNADIPIDMLRPGENVVTVTATYKEGDPFHLTAYIELETGSYEMPALIDWSRVQDVQDAGQCVDGHWEIHEDGLRPLHTGYDRVFLVGERHWRDYEVNVRVTVHRVDEDTGPRSGGNGLGILHRFQGHVIGGPRKFPPHQPKWGYQPVGSITWLRWIGGAGKPPEKQFYRGDGHRTTEHGAFNLELAKTYHLKSRSTTLEDTAEGLGVTRYQFKIWEMDTEEPAVWDFDETQESASALRSGGAALIAHHVDVTFGNVVIYDHTDV